MNQRTTLTQVDAIVAADAIAKEAGLPAYSALFQLAQRLADPAGELQSLDIYRNTARIAFEPPKPNAIDAMTQAAAGSSLGFR